MRASFIGGTAAVMLLAAGPVFAADMPLLKAPPMAPYSTWTGGYIGVAGGWIGGGSTTITHGPLDPNLPFFIGLPETNRFTVNGGLFGITDGYNWQFGSWVLGYESDTSFVLASGSAPDLVTIGTASNTVHLQNLSTWRARLGWTWSPDWLIYATGGAALVDERLDKSVPGFGVGQDHFVWGYAAGGGVEWRFAPSYSLKVEYMHVAFNEKGFIPVTMAAPLGFFADNRVKTSEDIVRVGLNMRFDLMSVLFR